MLSNILPYLKRNILLLHSLYPTPYHGSNVYGEYGMFVTISYYNFIIYWYFCSVAESEVSASGAPTSLTNFLDICIITPLGLHWNNIKKIPCMSLIVCDTCVSSNISLLYL